jgi:hypothetical protein
VSDLTARLEHGGNMPLGGLSALGGALAGAGIYLSLSGAILGLVIGLGVCGLLATFAALVARLRGGAEVPAAPARAAIQVAAPQVAPAVHEHFSPAAAAGTSRSATVQPAPAAPAAPATAAVAVTPDADAVISDTEAQLLNSGRFAEYHLAKAKRLMAAGQHREAAVQASASLAHGDLTEARSIYDTGRAAAKG